VVDVPVDEFRARPGDCHEGVVRFEYRRHCDSDRLVQCVLGQSCYIIMKYSSFVNT
jgi:hypothetical protein